MTERRKSNTRERALVEATLTCIARHGLPGTTLRRVAGYAGVTNGLIRFYFSTKDALIRAAYAHLLDTIFRSARATIGGLEAAPRERLVAFIAANLSPPIVAPDTVLLWANFLPLTYADAGMAEIREAWYRETTALYRSLIRDALAAAGQPHDEARLQQATTALNGLIDGLWLDASMCKDGDPAAFRTLGLAAAGRILGLDLGGGGE